MKASNKFKSTMTCALNDAVDDVINHCHHLNIYDLKMIERLNLFVTMLEDIKLLYISIYMSNGIMPTLNFDMGCETLKNMYLCIDLIVESDKMGATNKCNMYKKYCKAKRDDGLCESDNNNIEDRVYCARKQLIDQRCTWDKTIKSYFVTSPHLKACKNEGSELVTKLRKLAELCKVFIEKHIPQSVKHYVKNFEKFDSKWWNIKTLQTYYATIQLVLKGVDKSISMIEFIPCLQEQDEEMEKLCNEISSDAFQATLETYNKNHPGVLNKYDLCLLQNLKRVFRFVLEQRLMFKTVNDVTNEIKITDELLQEIKAIEDKRLPDDFKNELTKVRTNIQKRLKDVQLIRSVNSIVEFIQGCVDCERSTQFKELNKFVHVLSAFKTNVIESSAMSLQISCADFWNIVNNVRILVNDAEEKKKRFKNVDDCIRQQTNKKSYPNYCNTNNILTGTILMMNIIQIMNTLNASQSHDHLNDWNTFFNKYIKAINMSSNILIHSRCRECMDVRKSQRELDSCIP